MSQLLNQICPNVVEYFPELLQALTDTLWMVGISGFFAIIIGLPIGVLLVVTREGHLLQNKALNLVLGKVINVFPFYSVYYFISIHHAINTCYCWNDDWIKRSDCSACDLEQLHLSLDKLNPLY